MTLRKTILITGASSGLGEGMAREWAAKGRNLALCARRVDRLEALQAELLGKYPGIRVSVKSLDVNNHADVLAIFDESRYAESLYGVVSGRHLKRSTVLSTNRSFSEWPDVFPNAACVVTLVDSLTQFSDIAEIQAPSYRLRRPRRAAPLTSESAMPRRGRAVRREVGSGVGCGVHRNPADLGSR